LERNAGTSALTQQVLADPVYRRETAFADRLRRLTMSLEQEAFELRKWATALQGDRPEAPEIASGGVGRSQRQQPRMFVS
jgi:hypothetical protein